MKAIRHNRFTASVAVACVSLGVAAGATGAAEPSATVGVNAGPYAQQLDSNTLRQQANRELRLRMNDAEARLRRTQSRLSSAQRKLEREVSRQRANVDGQVFRLRSDADSRIRRLRSRVRSLRRDVRSLRRKVRGLRRQARAYAVQQQQLAIARASSTARGVWVLADGAGRVLNQSGGITVAHQGTGQYAVKFGTSRRGCTNLQTSQSPAGGWVSVSPTGPDTAQVTVRGTQGPRDGGFYLAAVC